MGRDNARNHPSRWDFSCRYVGLGWFKLEPAVPSNQPAEAIQRQAQGGIFPCVTTVPAAPGDVIILWGTGFGPSTPTAPTGVETPSHQLYSTSTLPTVTVNNVPATVYGAALGIRRALPGSQLQEFTSWLGKRSYKARLERLGLERLQEIARENGKKDGRPSGTAKKSTAQILATLAIGKRVSLRSGYRRRTICKGKARRNQEHGEQHRNQEPADQCAR
jgi:hypothetical protein